MSGKLTTPMFPLGWDAPTPSPPSVPAGDVTFVYSSASCADIQAWDIAKLVDGNHMYFQSELTKLLNDASFLSLVNGNYMFALSWLNYMPYTTAFPVLKYGSHMFDSCKYLHNIPSLEFPSLVDGSHMFYHCGIKDLNNGISFGVKTDANGITITNNVTATSMFAYCTKLMTLGDSVDLSGVQIGDFMFYDCTSLAFLPSTLSFKNLRSGNGMFFGCKSLRPEDCSRIIEALPDLSGLKPATLGLPSKHMVTSDSANLATNKNWRLNYG